MDKKKKVAMLGGSFDPVHLGHLSLLHNAILLSCYEKFLIVPAALSNFKQDNAPKATNKDRLEMLYLALEDYKELYPQDNNVDIEISTIELDRGGISYTYDTVMALKKSLNIDNLLGLIIGDDQIQNLTKWYKYEDLKNEVEFLICRRDSAQSHWTQIPKDVHYKKIEPKEIAPQSSSVFRENKTDYMNYLSKRVSQYVTEHNLYH